MEIIFLQKIFYSYKNTILTHSGSRTNPLYIIMNLFIGQIQFSNMEVLRINIYAHRNLFKVFKNIRSLLSLPENSSILYRMNLVRLLLRLTLIKTHLRNFRNTKKRHPKCSWDLFLNNICLIQSRYVYKCLRHFIFTVSLRDLILNH